MGGLLIAEDDKAGAGVGESVVFEVLVVLYLAELRDQSQDFARVADVGGPWCDAEVYGTVCSRA